MSQPALEGMPRRLYPAAPARLATYRSCPRRYRFAYLDQPTPPKGPPWAHVAVGASVHAALARWWGLPRARRTPAGGGELLAGAWLTDGFWDPAQARRTRDRTRRQVEDYLTGVDPDRTPVAVERQVGVRTARAGLWGRVDRIDDRPAEGLVVVDYKAGRSVPSVEDVPSSLALAVYAVGAARLLHRPCHRVELHHVPTGTVRAWEHSEDSLAAHLEQADAEAARLGDLDHRVGPATPVPEADAAFPARVGPQCGWCDFHAVCAPGRAVPRRESWSAVADQAGPVDGG